MSDLHDHGCADEFITRAADEHHAAGVPGVESVKAERPTPETDAFIAGKCYAPTGYQWRDYARRLERQRDEIIDALTELRRWVADGDCSDDAGIWPGFATTAYKVVIAKSDAAIASVKGRTTT